jgi:hypothetical protein
MGFFLRTTNLCGAQKGHKVPGRPTGFNQARRYAGWAFGGTAAAESSEGSTSYSGSRTRATNPCKVGNAPLPQASGTNMPAMKQIVNLTNNRLLYEPSYILQKKRAPR